MLRTRLECQYGLMDLLMSKRVLLDHQLSKVKELQSNLFEQNDKLIEMLLLQKDFKRYEDFLSALTQTNQSHLANYIIYNEGIAWSFLALSCMFSILSFLLFFHSFMTLWCSAFFDVPPLHLRTKNVCRKCYVIFCYLPAR